MDWVEELSDMGIEDVHRLVPPEDVNTAIARMVPEIRAQVIHATTLTPQQKSDLAPVLSVWNTLTGPKASCRSSDLH